MHCCPAQATYPQVPAAAPCGVTLFACGATGRYAASPEEGRMASLPIWSCSVWGLPCRWRCRQRGGLLPHPFTLTVRPLRAGWRFAFCCTGRPPALTLGSRTLSGTLPCGVRTFLSRPNREAGRQRPSGRLHRDSVPTGVRGTLPPPYFPRKVRPFQDLGTNFQPRDTPAPESARTAICSHCRQADKIYVQMSDCAGPGFFGRGK